MTEERFEQLAKAFNSNMKKCWKLRAGSERWKRAHQLHQDLLWQMLTETGLPLTELLDKVRALR